MMLIMRYPDGHKEAVRARIVTAAARALRRRGLAGISIPALMKQVGLTHGGFYAHFASRDELVAAAVRAAGDDTAARVFEAGLPLDRVAERYLSPTHVEHVQDGCVVAALGTSGPRQPARVRDAFAHVARGLLRLTEQALHPRRPAEVPSDQALVRAATMVGAIVLARLVKDPALSGRILDAARASLSS